MTVNDLINIFLRLEMAARETDSEIVFDSGKNGTSPLNISGVHLDEDGDVCLEYDERAERTLSPREIAEAVSRYDGNKDLYFIHTDANGESEFYNIKDGGTRDRYDSDLRMISARDLIEALSQFSPDDMLHFETGTVNFTVNSVYTDDDACLCLESNEIMELDDYPIGMLMEELSSVEPGTMVYFYDDDSKEFYGIHPSQWRIGKDGGPWMKVN